LSKDCCGPSDAGSQTCELSSEIAARPATPGVCPICGQRGKPVDGQTVKAMLAISLTRVTHEPYLFCANPDCAGVYYSADGEQTFSTAEVRERVYQKEPGAGDVFVCYCFRHTPDEIRAEIAATGRSTVVDAINAGIRAGACACDLRNPQGSCCLGNARALVKLLLAEKGSMATGRPEIKRRTS
jgi:hypothetical protein